MEALSSIENWSEIWIGEFKDYKYSLRVTRDEFPAIVIYEYDSNSTANYVFYVIFEDERPYWQLLLRDAVTRCYDLYCSGAEFEIIKFPGMIIYRDKERLAKLH